MSWPRSMGFTRPNISQWKRQLLEGLPELFSKPFAANEHCWGRGGKKGPPAIGAVPGDWPV